MTQPPDRSPHRIEQFIRNFFGSGNAVWPDQDPESGAGRNLIPYLQVLRDGSDIPVVLPRRREAEAPLLAYVIAVTPAHAARAAELLTAFVGPSYATFDGLPAQLDPDDPVDRAVLEFAGDGLTFVLASPTAASQANAWRALDHMQALMRLRPVRSWHVPKPVGRLLAEFEIALAAGDNSASAGLIEQLTASAGLSAPNLAHLRIKRLSRLGRDEELLRMPGLPDVVLADPPQPVKDAILAAIYGRVAAGAPAIGDLTTASDNLIEAGALVPALLAGTLTGLSAEALTVLALAAWLRRDTLVLQRLLHSEADLSQVERLAPPLAEAIRTLTDDLVSGSESQEQDRAEPEPAIAASWLELTQAIAAGENSASTIIAEETWRGWDPPSLDDKAIAQLLAALDDESATRAWALAGAFVDAVGFALSAPLAARELINNALAHGRFSPADLAGLVALTEVALRAGPAEHDYASLTDDLGSESGRWAGPDRAGVVLDMVDLLARAPCPDIEARLRLVISLLRPLHDHFPRLERDQLLFARQLDEELGGGLAWHLSESGAEAPDDSRAFKVLLYSLDEGVLERTSAVLSTVAPAADVKLSHEHTGTPRLRQFARGADVIVIATRCAKHAATGFIRANAAPTAVVTEADGSGSASLLRAAVAALDTARSRARP